MITGEVRVLLTLDAKGRVAAGAVVHSDVQGPEHRGPSVPLSNCVLRSLETMRFPDHGGPEQDTAEVTVEFSLAFGLDRWIPKWADP